MTPALILALIAQAARLSGLPPAPPPDIRIVKPAEIHAMACPTSARCPVLGLFADGVIYLLPDAPPSVALHEAVHYLQWRQGGSAWGCREWARREQQAYSVQMMALEAEGASTLSVSLGAQMVTCR